MTWPDGKKKARTRRLDALAGALGGCPLGMLFGLIFSVPLLRMAVGAAAGALGGMLKDIGIDDGFINRAGEEATPGTSALIGRAVGPTGGAGATRFAVPGPRRVPGRAPPRGARPGTR